jgi:hypothetical protein
MRKLVVVLVLLVAGSAHAQSLSPMDVDQNLQALARYQGGHVFDCLSRRAVRYPTDNSATALEDCDVPDQFAPGAIAFMAGQTWSNGSAWVDQHCKPLDGGGYRCEWHGATAVFH